MGMESSTLTIVVDVFIREVKNEENKKKLIFKKGLCYA